jgi:hypothetical protein
MQQVEQAVNDLFRDDLSAVSQPGPDVWRKRVDQAGGRGLQLAGRDFPRDGRLDQRAQRPDQPINEFAAD